jgi:hypothetical protein
MQFTNWAAQPVRFTGYQIIYLIKSMLRFTVSLSMICSIEFNTHFESVSFEYLLYVGLWLWTWFAEQ